MYRLFINTNPAWAAPNYCRNGSMWNALRYSRQPFVLAVTAARLPTQLARLDRVRTSDYDVNYHRVVLWMDPHV